MKIAYVLTDHPRLSHTFITSEIHALQELGIEVIPVSLNRIDPADIMTEADQHEADRTYHLKATPLGRIAWVVASAAVRHPGAFLRGCMRALRSAGSDTGTAARRLAQFGEALLVHEYCRSAGITRLHAHFGQAPSTVAWFTAAFANDVGAGPQWTWSVTIHGWHEFAEETRSALALKVRAADLVVCISDYTRSQIYRLADPSDWDKVEVVRCGIAPHSFASDGLPGRPSGDPPVIVMVARLAPEKGHAVLLEAAARLQRAGMAVRLRLVGDGPSRARIEQLIAANGITDLVEMTGRLAPRDVRSVLADADLFCIPSFAEGLPVSIMEAMAVGVPVVTSPVGGITELAVDGVTAWVVPPGDPQRLADTIREVLTDPDRHRVVEAARARVIEQHDIGRNVERLAALLRRCHGDEAQPSNDAYADPAASTVGREA